MANETLVQAIKNGIDTFNRWCARFPEANLDLQGADLTGCNLQNFRLNEADLRNANLVRAKLVNAVFIKSNLSGASLHEVDGRNATFERCDLIGTNFTNARIQSAKFLDGSLDDAIFENSQLGSTIFEKVSLSGTRYFGAKLSDVRFMDCRIEHTDFSSTSGHQLRLSGHLDRAKLNNADLSHFICDKNTNFSNCDLLGAKLHNPQMRQCRFRECNFTESSITDGDLSSSSMSNCLFVTSKCSNSTLDFSQIELLDAYECDFSGVRFHKCKVLDSSFERAILKNASFKESELTKCDLSHSSLVSCDFSAAGIFSSNFFQADISSATFSEVKGAASAFNLAESFVHEPTRLFERCTRRTLDVWLDWERLRSIGRVPIFAPSALVLVFIPLFLYFLARYNSVLHPLIEWAHQAGADPTAAGNLFASHLIDSGLAEVTPPSQLLWTLIATLLLLMGSTIFFFGCPAEVKEFSRNQWIHEHKKDLTHYWPKSWRYPAARVLCASFYGAGGVIAILILVTKFIHVARYVIEHTPHPWYLF